MNMFISDRKYERQEIAFAGIVVLVGVALRVKLALLTSLNPDEALHALVAFDDWGPMLRNSLSITHPPLFISLLHVISRVSRAEFALRLGPLLAGILFPV